MGDEGSLLPGLLLALLDPCLLLVLQCCAADDPRSLFSAARAHSRLHQVAVVALRSITARVSQQQQIEGVMAYMGKHSQHVNSLKLTWAGHTPLHYPPLHQLPQQLQLTSLQFDHFSLQLQPGNGFQGVLGDASAVAALKQLRLNYCQLLDHGPTAAFTATLAQLAAGLEHLSIRRPLVDGCFGQIAAAAAPHLP